MITRFFALTPASDHALILRCLSLCAEFESIYPVYVNKYVVKMTPFDITNSLITL